MRNRKPKIIHLWSVHQITDRTDKGLEAEGANAGGDVREVSGAYMHLLVAVAGGVVVR